MKIIYYSAHPKLSLNGQGGYATHMNEIIDGFERLGNQVFPVIMGDINSSTAKMEKSHSYIKTFLKKWVPKILWRTIKDMHILQFDRYAARVLEKKVLEISPDLIYERVAFMQTSGVRMAKKHSIRHFMELNAPTVDETYSQEEASSLLAFLAYRMEKKQLKTSDTLFPVSKALGNFFEKRYEISSKKFYAIPNAINPNNIKVNSTLRQELINTNNLKNRIVIGFVGSIFGWHKVDWLINAFDEIDCSNCTLLIVGNSSDDTLFKKLILLAKKKKKVKDIVFIGRVPHNLVFTYIDVMDICISPNNLWYMSPIKIFEYGAMGKAIIAPNIGPINDVLKHKKNVLLITPSIENLRNAINSLVQNRQMMEQISINVRIHILEKHTWENNVEKILEHH